uniref:Lysozyme n=1 Tax=Salvator merianae TaxID=96440 RepID=A0A8D0DZP4_SALMN
MKALMVLTLVCLLIAVTEAKVFERCELARTLKRLGLSGYRGHALGNWICLAYYESRYNTRAVGPPNWDGSRDYGIFQINSRWWCDNGRRPTANGCRKPCSGKNFSFSLYTFIFLFILISRVAWRNHCKGRNLSGWTRGCGV